MPEFFRAGADSTVGGAVSKTLAQQIDELGRTAAAARRVLAVSITDQRNQAVTATAAYLREREPDILEANAQDLEQARAHGQTEAFLDRLELNEERIEGLACELQHVAELPDRLGEMTEAHTRDNGLRIMQMRVPIGVIGMIYEARPGVTIEAGGLCIKAGNAVILRGGSDAARSNQVLAQCLRDGLAQAGLPAACLQLLPTTDREAIEVLLKMDQWIDLIIPRGGKELIKRVLEHTRIPVLKHLHGVCHVYLDDAADADQAVRIAVNAKTQRYGVCNAMETLLVARSRAAELLPRLAAEYQAYAVELRGCAQTCKILPQVAKASEEDWSTEYLAPVLAIRVVDDLEQAIEHIECYGSHHTDSIVTEDPAHATQFVQRVDSSSVLVNASTRFADGFEYGLGAEIGISTDKIHARGPVALEGLTNRKFVVYGDGQIRV